MRRARKSRGSLTVFDRLLVAGLLLFYAGLVVVPATRPIATVGLLGTDDQSGVLARAIVGLLVVNVGPMILS